MKKIPLQPVSEKKEKAPLSPFSKGMIIAIGVLSLIMVAITFIDMAGYHLIIPEVNPLGCVLMLILLLIWAAVLLYRRIQSPKLKKIVGLLFVLVIMILATFGATLVMQYTSILMPHKYGMIQSPAGKKVVIMNIVDTGLGSDEEFSAMLERMDARVEYIEANATPAPEATAAPEAETEPEVTTEPALENAAEITESYPYAAYGYIYSAFPVRLGIFYDSHAEIDGLIYRGAESQSKLLYEWQDDATVRFYLENAEPGDSGEVTLKLK